jgi:lactoylglutathione lyase
MKSETNVKQAVPFFRVSNIEASVRYYVDGLGFEMTRKWIDEGKLRWCWLQHGGAALMLQEFRKEGHDSWAPQGEVGEGVSICFLCEDALATYRHALQCPQVISVDLGSNSSRLKFLRGSSNEYQSCTQD